MKSRYFCGILIIALIFSGCASKSAFEGKADLCGMIVDENNQPVEDYVVYYRKKMTEKSSATNSSGLFVLHDVSSGEFSLYGEKSGYTKLADQKNTFFDRTKIICFQVNSLDLVLENVNKLIELKKYEDALELIQNVAYNKGTNEEYVICCYESFLADVLNKTRG